MDQAFVAGDSDLLNRTFYFVKHSGNTRQNLEPKPYKLFKFKLCKPSGFGSLSSPSEKGPTCIQNGTVSNVSENLMFTLCCLNCSVFRLHLICSWHLMLTCICRPSPAGSTAPTVMRPTVFPRMEPSSCTRSSVVHWMTLSLCCGHLGPVARATPCAHTASAIRLSET